MKEPSPFASVAAQASQLLTRVATQLERILHLRDDLDESGTVQSIRDNVDFRSANAWTLVFAIFIASIGLNTNSAAVIIGAMLISPLMGPIVGAGLALGINDFALLKRALRNLSIAVVISIGTSTIYFLLSPMSEAHSELLARVHPTFFDVMIGFFGGAAGIVAASRSQKGTAIPGVAIATALMPPLCTVGYGLATFKVAFVGGAFFLFIINSLFICLSTFLFVRYMQFKPVAHPSEVEAAKIRRVIAIAIIAITVPSIYSAYRLQKQSVFKSRVESFVTNELVRQGVIVLNKQVKTDWLTQNISLDVYRESIDEALMASIQQKLAAYELTPKDVSINLSRELPAAHQNEEVNTESVRLRALETRVELAMNSLQKASASSTVMRDLKTEMTLLYPHFHGISSFKQDDPQQKAMPPEKPAENEATESTPVQEPSLVVVWKKAPSKAEKFTSSAFIQTRLKDDDRVIQHAVLSP